MPTASSSHGSIFHQLLATVLASPSPQIASPATLNRLIRRTPDDTLLQHQKCGYLPVTPRSAFACPAKSLTCFIAPTGLALGCCEPAVGHCAFQTKCVGLDDIPPSCSADCEPESDTAILRCSDQLLPHCKTARFPSNHYYIYCAPSTDGTQTYSLPQRSSTALITVTAADPTLVWDGIFDDDIVLPTWTTSLTDQWMKNAQKNLTRERMNKVNAPLIGGVIAGVVVGFMGIITCVFWMWKSGREWARIQREAVDEGYVASSHEGNEDKVTAVVETGFSDSELEIGDEHTGVHEDDGLGRTPTSTIISMGNEVVVGTVGNEIADSATRVSSWTADASGELSSTSADTESVTYQRSVGS